VPFWTSFAQSGIGCKGRAQVGHGPSTCLRVSSLVVTLLQGSSRPLN